MNKFLFRSLWVSLLFLLPAFGCGKKSEGPPVVPVSGRITLNKAPLAKATIRFQPAARETDGKPNPDSWGETDEDGKFTLKAIASKEEWDGALPGEHYVQITLFDREASPPVERLPAKYNSESTLKFVVPPEGTKEANFELTTK